MKEEAFRQLEDRVSQLEEELKQIKAQLLERNPPGWKAIVGINKGDKTFEKIVREGRKIRRADCEAACADDKQVERKC